MEYQLPLPLSPSESTGSFSLSDSESDFDDLSDLEDLLEDENVEHKHIKDLDSGLTALRALVPYEWTSSTSDPRAVAEVLDITCQYIKHQKRNERKNIATWKREIAALEKQCEELWKDKEDMAMELERAKGMQRRRDLVYPDEVKGLTEMKDRVGTKRGREAAHDDAQENGDEKKPRIKLGEDQTQE